MKTFSKILSLFICVFLYISSCDLLYTDEEEEVDYITVDVSLGVFVRTADGGFATSTNVHIKIYKEGVSISKALTTGDNGWVNYYADTYRMRKGEVFTASAYLMDHPDVYASTSVTFEVANTNAVDIGDKAKFYSWRPELYLQVPG